MFDWFIYKYKYITYIYIYVICVYSKNLHCLSGFSTPSPPQPKSLAAPQKYQKCPAVRPLQRWSLLRRWRFAGDWTKDLWTGAVGPAAATAPPGVFMPGQPWWPHSTESLLFAKPIYRGDLLINQKKMNKDYNYDQVASNLRTLVR